ncbi:MAG: T9SS type A sorting domain-containing protein, partial [Bacteroidota bacterium]
YQIGISNDAGNPTVYIGGERAMFYRVDDAATASPGDEVRLDNTVPAAVSQHFISSVTVHPNDASIVYVTFTTVSGQSRVWKATNADDIPTWTAIGGDLPSQLPVNWLAVHPDQPDSFLVAATDYGVYTTTNGGVNWEKETDIPNVPVFQLRMRAADRKLFIYTHGRGIYQADLPFLVNRDAPRVEGITAYPNPADVQLRLQSTAHDLKGASYRLFNTAGQVVGAGAIDMGTVPTARLEDGIYFLEVEGEFGKWRDRVMVLH